MVGVGGVAAARHALVVRRWVDNFLYWCAKGRQCGEEEVEKGLSEGGGAVMVRGVRCREENPRTFR